MQNPIQINFEEIDSYIKHDFCYEAHETEFDIKEPSPNYASINDFIKQSDEILQDNIRKYEQQFGTIKLTNGQPSNEGRTIAPFNIKQGEA